MAERDPDEMAAAIEAELPMSRPEMLAALARLDMDEVTAAVQSAPWPGEDAAAEQAGLDRHGYGGLPGDSRFT